MAYSEVSPEVEKAVRELKMVYTDQPQPELLIKIPVPESSTEIGAKIVSPEVTSLCPLAPTQPDYATVTIEYIPDKYLVELKSLKFYLVSFRSVQIFHEALAGKILDDLVTKIEPKNALVTCEFTARGGIYTTIEADYEKA